MDYVSCQNPTPSERVKRVFLLFLFNTLLVSCQRAAVGSAGPGSLLDRKAGTDVLRITGPWLRASGNR